MIVLIDRLIATLFADWPVPSGFLDDKVKGPRKQMEKKKTDFCSKLSTSKYTRSTKCTKCFYLSSISMSTKHRKCLEIFQMLLDAAIVVGDDGTILSVYDMNEDGAEETMADLMSQGMEVADFRGKLIVPGFVDGHAHAPQVCKEKLKSVLTRSRK